MSPSPPRPATIYQIAVDGLNGASGSISLSIYSQQASTGLYSTGFEAKEGFGYSLPITAGTGGWLTDGSGGEGNLSGQDGMPGQQAFVGSRRAGQPLATWALSSGGRSNYLPTPAEPIVKFSVTMAINDSSNLKYDDFQWQLYNKERHPFFTIDFDNNDLGVYYLQDGASNFVDTGVQFTNGDPMQLTVVMDFANNLWSAALNGHTFVRNKPIRTGKAALDFRGHGCRLADLLPRFPRG